MFFLVLGQFGLYLAALELGLSVFAAAGIAALLPFQNYTLTNWITRGAFSETSSMLLVPWLFFLCLRMIRSKTIPKSLFLILVLQYYAHSVIFLFCGMILILAVFCSAFSWGLANCRKNIRDLCIQFVLMVLCLAPFLLAWIKVRPQMDFSSLISGYAHYSYNFLNREAFFSDNWLWNTWQGLSFKLSEVTLMMLGISLSIVMIVIFLKLKSAKKMRRRFR